MLFRSDMDVNHPLSTQDRAARQFRWQDDAIVIERRSGEGFTLPLSLLGHREGPADARPRGASPRS